MNTSVSTMHISSVHSARRTRVRRARNFFIIAVLAALVSVAGHCLPGEAPQAGASTDASQTSGTR
jgi:hypothetical protein